jgi:hypothetical protein
MDRTVDSTAARTAGSLLAQDICIHQFLQEFESLPLISITLPHSEWISSPE